jgi:hypothetical protein
MKVILKYIPIAITSIACGLSTVSASAGKLVVQPLAPDSLHLMNETLDKISSSLLRYDDLSSAFADLVAARPDGCPTIHSKVYCERIKLLGYKDQEGYELRLRMIGIGMLSLLDSESLAASRNGVASEKRLAKVQTLLELAEWLEMGRGYGNIIIGGRARAVALLHLSFLSVDMTCYIGTIKELKRRTAGTDVLLAWRKLALEALEAEIGEPPILGYRLAKDAEELFTEVAKREKEIIIIRKRDFEKPLNKYMALDKEHYIEIRNKLPFGEAIFVQDSFANFPNKTTTGLWDCHRVIPRPPYYLIAGYVESVLVFRENVGGFPLQPLPPDTYINGKINTFYGSEIRAAFYLAWKNFSMQEKFRKSNHYRDPKTGELIFKREQSLAGKYLDMHADNGASAIYESIHKNNAGILLGDDAPSRIREGRLLD